MGQVSNQQLKTTVLEHSAEMGEEVCIHISLWLRWCTSLGVYSFLQQTTFIKYHLLLHATSSAKCKEGIGDWLKVPELKQNTTYQGTPSNTPVQWSVWVYPCSPTLTDIMG